jgi:hypothetical protein
MTELCKHERTLVYRPETEGEAERWPAVKVRRVCADCCMTLVDGQWGRPLGRTKASYTVEFKGKDGGVVAVPVTVTTHVHAGVIGNKLPEIYNLPEIDLAEEVEVAEAEAFATSCPTCWGWKGCEACDWTKYPEHGFHACPVCGNRCHGLECGEPCLA